MSRAWYSSSIDIARIEELYFDKGKTMSLKKGDLLLRKGQLNHRLFLVKSGELGGYFGEVADQFEIFHSSKDMFIGVYSFFSDDHISYMTIIAKSDCQLLYMDPPMRAAPDFANHFLPILVEELKLRQQLAQSMYLDREEMIQRIFSHEKLSTLGELAAGLAHELNNSIALIGRKAEFVSGWIAGYLPRTTGKENSGLFNRGLQDGIIVSTKELREQRRNLESKGLSREKAELLTALGDLDGAMKHTTEAVLKEQLSFLELGQNLREISIAATHSAHVVSSVKELGVKRRLAPTVVDVNQTIREALLLLRALTGKVRITEEFGELPEIEANAGDLIQIWLNLVKNASESLVSSATPRPEINIRTALTEDGILIRISDNGPGIPEEIKPVLFHPNVSTKSDGMTFGLGLGLSIVARIIEAYQGRIWVESTPGNTHFSIILPYNHGKAIHHMRG